MQCILKFALECGRRAARWRSTLLLTSMANSPQWISSLRKTASASSDRCSAARDGPPPHTAVCIAGAARAFATPLLLAALRHNLLAALGTSRVRLFVQLKLSDTEKVAGINRVVFRPHTAQLATLRSALRLSWLSSALEEVSIVNGSGAWLGAGVAGDEWRRSGAGSSAGTTAADGDGPSSPPLLVPSDEGLWGRYAAKRCTPSAYLRAGTNEQRLLLGHLSQAWCRDAISRAENRSGRRFDVVAFSRPDYVWWRPLPPWCAWGWRDRDELLSCNRTGCDMAWAAPRKYMGVLLAQALLHRECATSQCCGTPEQLFQYAKQLSLCRARVRAGQLPPAALGACRDSGGLGGQGGQGGQGGAGGASGAGDEGDEGAGSGAPMPPERDVFVVRPPLGVLGSLLRSAEDACALAWATGPSARVEAHRQGLPQVTAEKLRAMFGDDIGACERALRPVTSDGAWDI